MSLQDILDSAVVENAVPFVVAMTASSKGVTFSGAAGQDREGRDADMDTAFRIFSMSKAIGATAAMILIDRGELTMDTPVADILPEWNDLRVIDGWEGDQPILRPQRGTATIRHLATHTAGAAYEGWSLETMKVMRALKLPTATSGSRAALNYPLVADPGTKWSYGVGVDWLGLVVERIAGERIDSFCQCEIFDPLGMTDTVFEPGPVADRLASVSARGKDGQFGPSRMAPPQNPEVYGMGHALYATAPDYLRFLRMVLNKGALNGNRILSERAIGQMLADQMQGLAFEPMISLSKSISADVTMPPGATHSFAFVRHGQGVPGKRRAGSQSWAGICNTHYWIDPVSDVAAVLMTQSLPFVEAPFQNLYDRFERAVYADLQG